MAQEKRRGGGRGGAGLMLFIVAQVTDICPAVSLFLRVLDGAVSFCFGLVGHCTVYTWLTVSRRPTVSAVPVFLIGSGAGYRHFVNALLFLVLVFCPFFALKWSRSREGV